MIPYTVQQVYPNNDSRYDNVYTRFDCIEKDKFDERIINIITDFMCDFCSKDSRHNTQITSFYDFCRQYWETEECIVRGWKYIFRIHYFEIEWNEWNIEDYVDQIFIAYMIKSNSNNH
jgi:hypothetical protein